MKNHESECMPYVTAANLYSLRYELYYTQDIT